MKVVMLDDSPTFLMAAERVLSSSGISATRIETWVEIGVALHRDAPDVLILDLNMPKFDGAQVAQMVRRFSDCPILFLSNEPAERLRAVCVGIEDSTFLEKRDLATALVPKLLEFHGKPRPPWKPGGV